MQRRAGRGPHVGQFFWGCSRFPKCRWTQSIPDIGPTPDPLAGSQHPSRPEQIPEVGGAVIGIAGGSAQAEYERRAAKHRARVSADLPQLVVMAIFLGVAVYVFFKAALHTDAPMLALVFGGLFFLGRVLPRMSTVAWSTGAEGEVATATWLDPLADDGFVVMHDLRISMSRANIDHVVIGPTGVFVIETKNIKGRVRVDGGTLRMAGRRVRAVEEIEREMEAVWNALGAFLQPRNVGIQGIICAHRADLPWLRRNVGGVRLAYPRDLPGIITKGISVLSESDVAELRALAERRLPPRIR